MRRVFRAQNLQSFSYHADESHLNGITQFLQTSLEIKAFRYLQDGMLATILCPRWGMPYPNFGHFIPCGHLSHAENGHISTEIVIKRLWDEDADDEDADDEDGDDDDVDDEDADDDDADGEDADDDDVDDEDAGDEDADDEDADDKVGTEVEGIGMCRVAGGFS